MKQSTMEYLVHYCPLDGLEYRALRIVGWTEEHRLTVDGKPWCKMRKATSLPQELLRCLN